MDVVTLLQSKNRCLQRLHEISQTFLSAALSGDFSGLEHFQSRREAAMKAMELYDRKISSEASRLTHTEKTREIARAVEICLSKKRELIMSIMRLDDRIIGCIEAERNRVASEVASAAKSREAMGKFKSEWVQNSGEGLDEKL